MADKLSTDVKIKGKKVATKGSVAKHDSPVHMQLPGTIKFQNAPKKEGFDKLSFKDQLEILNYRDNFIGLSESANKSKGSKSYKDWQYYKKDTSEEIEVCPEFREKMIDRENQLTKDLQNLINIKQKGVNNI